VLAAVPVLLVGVGTCVLRRPEGLAANDGLSWYGVHPDTVVPYLFAVLGCAACCAGAARELGPLRDGPTTRPLRTGLGVAAGLLVAIALTPYEVGRVVEVLHEGFGTGLYACELVLTAWLVRVDGRPLLVVAAALQLAAGLVAAWSLPRAGGFLIQAQVAYQLAALTVFALALDVPGTEGAVRPHARRA
jgi:hypothetical protein